MHLFLTSMLALSVQFSTLQKNAPTHINQLPGDVQEISIYDAAGHKIQSGLMEDGQKTGEWISFTTEGRIQAKAYYDHGVKTGKWRVYSESGELRYLICYRNDVRIWAQSFDADGKLVSFNYTAER